MKNRFMLKRIKQNQPIKTDKLNYQIKDLYVAQIVKSPLSDYSPNKYFSTKQFVICYLCDCCNEFRAINDCNLPNIYILDNVKPFCISMYKYMENNNLTIHSKLSLTQINKIEQQHNKHQDYAIILN